MTSQRYTLIKNARLIDGEGSGIKNCSILIRNADSEKDSEILEIGEVKADGEISRSLTVYNARSHYVCHGFTDLSTHACEPGNMHKETLKSASEAAKKGGFTAFLTVNDTNPAPNDPLVIKYIVSNSAGARCRVYASGSLFLPGEKGISPIDEIMSEGAKALRCSGDFDDDMLFGAMKICRDKGYPLIVKCSQTERNISRWEDANRYQDIATARLLLLAEEAECPVHISCVSTARAVELIRMAKAHGLPVTCDTCPQYFIFSAADIPLYGNDLLLMPPLGSSADVEGVRQGIADKTIDCISSDHAPCSPEEKRCSADAAARGMISLQTVFSTSYSHLVGGGIISIRRLVQMLSENPARVLGLSGKVKVGQTADLTVFSTLAEGKLTKEQNMSKSENSPFFGQFLQGQIIQTFVNGR